MQGIWEIHVAPSGADNPDASAGRLLEMISQTLQLPDEAFQQRYIDLIAQIERNCRRQEEWLDALQADLSRQHLEEHARMLGVMHHTAFCVMQGDIAMGRTAACLLGDWIRAHAETMDKPLAEAILQKRAHHRSRFHDSADLIDTP